MTAYVIRRLLTIIPTLIGITLITFVLIRLAPGDPAEIQAGGAMSQETDEAALRAMREHYGLDKPWWEQYIIWVGRLAVLDFGDSFKDNRPVLGRIVERVPRTVGLNLISLLFVYLIALPMGILSAITHKSAIDKTSGILLFVLFSIPNFWLALLLQRFFSVDLEWLPLVGFKSTNHDELSFLGQYLDIAKHSLLILICLSVNSFAFVSRFIRTTMLETISQDYIRTAKAKGLNPVAVYLKHALRNTLIPVITLMATILPALLSGSVILERIFNWPGLGMLFFDAILTRDYPTIMANSFISSLLILVSLLIADILYVVVDPRVSLD